MGVDFLAAIGSEKKMGELEHDIVVYSSDTIVMIYGIDQDEYCHMDLVADINKATLPASNANVDTNENKEVGNMVVGENENREVDNVETSGINLEFKVGNVETGVVNVKFEVGNGETDVVDNDKEDGVYGFSFEDEDWRGEGDDVPDSRNDCQYVGPISTCEEWDANSDGFSDYQSGNEGGRSSNDSDDVENMNGDSKQKRKSKVYDTSDYGTEFHIDNG
ncbi:unnamed protein product [Ilex paraguariensis]|uniref:Uncharacterized protein n=1 Tax=Ilex paraguariensis TaxID=185542 RepID=A0ABC8T8F7_9AQUA